MKPAVIMDTNVAVVANGKTAQASRACVVACLDRLKKIRNDERLLLDRGWDILEEYLRHLCPSGQPGAGDAFFKWLWNNQGNPEVCRWVPITPHRGRGFEEFPGSDELADFDRSDRKFVAVALACGESPPILNAADRDWWQHRGALERRGIRIDFLCPDLMDGG